MKSTTIKRIRNRFRRTAFAVLFFVAAAIPAHAQKMYVARFSGSAVLLMANGTQEKIAVTTPITYGDVLATGEKGSITVFMPGVFSLAIPEHSIVGYFFAGPGTAPRPFISVIKGTATVTTSGVAVNEPEIRKEPTDEDSAIGSANAAIGQTVNCLETLYSQLGEFEKDYQGATEELERATGEYRDLLANGTSGTLQAFRTAKLYPAQDARSSIIHEMQYRTILARTIRRLIIAPLYMTMKTSYPQPETRNAETLAFFARYSELVERYENQFYRNSDSNSSGGIGFP